MKMRIFKLFMLPIAAFTLASAAAVSTDNSHKSKATYAMTAYIHDPNINSCKEVTVDCIVGAGQTCLSGSWTAFGKDTPVTCNQQLKRVQ